jgi:hypothetical protein
MYCGDSKRGFNVMGERGMAADCTESSKILHRWRCFAMNKRLMIKMKIGNKSPEAIVLDKCAKLHLSEDSSLLKSDYTQV